MWSRCFFIACTCWTSACAATASRLTGIRSNSNCKKLPDVGLDLSWYPMAAPKPKEGHSLLWGFPRTCKQFLSQVRLDSVSLIREFFMWKRSDGGRFPRVVEAKCAAGFAPAPRLQIHRTISNPARGHNQYGTRRIGSCMPKDAAPPPILAHRCCRLES